MIRGIQMDFLKKNFWLWEKKRQSAFTTGKTRTYTFRQ